MSRETIALTNALRDYMRATWLREPPILARLREETGSLGDVARMQIAPEQGQFMGFLVELTGARKALEIGTFTGYSALAMALALPADGRLVACDLSAEWTLIARRFWAEAGVAEKIDLRLGAALETLDGLLATGEAETFDVAFIDADKEGYDTYYERVLRLLRRGGLVMIDNVFRGGRVADRDPEHAATRTIHELNRKMRRDERVSLAIVPIGDGLTLARKR